MKIVGIGGSLRKDSHTYKALEIALAIVRAHGIDAELIDLRNMDLPFCNGGKEYDGHSDVEKLRKKIVEAQGIILATPEYHGSVSGVLKNALDLLDVEHVEGKIFAIMSVLGGKQGAGACSTLRHICRQMHAWVIPKDLMIPDANHAFNKTGGLQDEELAMRMQELVISLLDSIKRLK